MFETSDLAPMRPEDRTITIFLNRACPRTCYQCGIADNSRTSMSTANWLKALDNLHRAFGATFFLFLGVEPLLLKDGMVEIVRWLRERKLEAAWYTTSPEPMFSRYREALVAAGVDNWSSGVDTLPHLDPLDPVTHKKAVESIEGLKWMAARGVKTHTTTTVHRKNLHLVSTILKWLHQNIPNVELAVNFIEWRKEPGFDFFSPPEDMLDMLWEGTEDERTRVRVLMDEVRGVRKEILKAGGRFHTTDEQLSHAHIFYDKLDLHCRGAIGPSVDADGTMRMCGYHTGWKTKEFNVLDLDPATSLVKDFNLAWTQDVFNCSGCYWGCFRLPAEHMVPFPHTVNVPARSLPQVQAKLGIK